MIFKLCTHSSVITYMHTFSIIYNRYVKTINSIYSRLGLFRFNSFQRIGPIFER